jgi:hypothetical protein
MNDKILTSKLLEIAYFLNEQTPNTFSIHSDHYTKKKFKKFTKQLVENKEKTPAEKTESFLRHYGNLDMYSSREKFGDFSLDLLSKSMIFYLFSKQAGLKLNTNSLYDSYSSSSSEAE